MPQKSRFSKSPNEEYFAGNISADQYLRKIENSKEGDRRRRSIEERVNKLSREVQQLCFK